MRASASRSLVLALLAAAAPCAHAGDLHVPADYATIQAAIDAAVNGDAVLVAPGTYVENIDFKGKAITVQGTDGSAATTIDGGAKDTVVRFTSGEGSGAILDGFHVRNGHGNNATYPIDGGGVSFHGGSTATIRNCEIEGSYAWAGGGISIDASSPTIEHCLIRSNVGESGGGVVIWSGASPLIINCAINWNRTNQYGGGAITCSFSSPVIVNTVMAMNTTGGWEGGALQQGAGASSTLINCVLWGNTANVAGGVFAWTSPAVLWNCVVRENKPDQLVASLGGSISANSCDVQGGWSGTNIFDADPLFADASNGDFHLSVGSPCIDTDDDTAPNLLATDFEGDPRIIGAHVDVGADEATLAPVVLGVSPGRTRYDAPTSVTISGAAFSAGSGTTVSVGGASASNVVVVDDATITCDFPGGLPGPADVVVSNNHGAGAFANGFVYTPAITIEGDATLGATITIHDLCDPGDGIFAVLGLPPQVSIPTPPFGGDLAIVPFHYFFYVTTWPFDSFDVPATIPNDPALSGVDVLLQSLIGAKLTTPPKQGHWTNCAVLSIH